MVEANYSGQCALIPTHTCFQFSTAVLKFIDSTSLAYSQYKIQLLLFTHFSAIQNILPANLSHSALINPYVVFSKHNNCLSRSQLQFHKQMSRFTSSCLEETGSASPLSPYFFLPDRQALLRPFHEPVQLTNAAE